ncbi:glycosyltransferase family 9 protein [Candidatus Dependentiae bacterium]|nr:glycosyltransferase family 9 protein [Candidatus Dependentiae bacterium]
MNLFKWIFYNFSPKYQYIDFSKINSVLIIRNDHIGDVCLSIPFIHLLKQTHKHIKTDVLTGEYTYEILSGNPYIDNIIIQNKTDKINDIIKKAGTYDIVFNLCSSKFNAVLTRKIPAKIKIGYAYKIYNIFSFNRFVYIHRKNPPIHETEFCFEFLKSLGFTGNTKKAVESSEIFIDEKSKAVSDRLFIKMNFDQSKKIIGIHSGDSKSAFNWKLDKYIELGESLSKKYNIVFIFGPQETSALNNFTDSQKIKFRFIEGNLKLKELAYFISKIDCLVSGSTGPMHIAGLMRTPTVSLFSNKPSHSYLKWHPLNNNFKIIEPEINYSKKNKYNIMDSITVEKTIKEILCFEMISLGTS